MVFFTKYLSECVAESGVPAMMPLMFTQSDLFARISGLECADRVQLILRLYDIYKGLNDKCESLDDFVFWGDVLLGDFDDVDKYLVDPAKLFANVSDFKGLRDDFSYLSDSQKEAMERFMSHFHKDGVLVADTKSDNPGIKGRFLLLWELLLPLYEGFRERLGSEGKAYEGMIYRKVADMLSERSVSDILPSVFNDVTGFVFVGLNALNECEKRLMDRMRDAGIAEFCWDFSSKMIKDPRNKASFFMSDNVRRYKPAFETDPDGLPEPHVRVISVPSSVGQAKQLPRIFEGIGSPGIDTAVVLPDESMLLPVLNSIPESIEEVNVTMGYPMKGSEIHSLIGALAAMQTHARRRGESCSYYFRQVYAVFSNGLFKAASDEADRDRTARIKADAKYYIPSADLDSEGLFSLLFRPVAGDPADDSPEMGIRLGNYVRDVVSGIASRILDKPDMALELDFAKEYYLAAGKLSSLPLPVRPSTWFHLLEQLVGGMSVPFKGEPLKGLQVMGPLETRALDFKHLIILSCNEGVFPHRSVSSSFIPPELRKGFGLPTYEYQDAVWAYYFYRMIQRASDVTLLYDSRTEGLKSGEESRYIGQLELHFGLDLERLVASSALVAAPAQDSFPKTDSDMEKLKDIVFSPSSLRNYLACQAMFCYSKVRDLKAEDEISDSLDGSMIGNVYHEAMQKLYSAGPIITKTYIKSVLEDKALIRDLVRDRVKKQLKTDVVSGRNLIFEGMLRRYVRRTLESDLEMLSNNGLESFRILGLERPMTWNLGPFRFGGTIDRLDALKESEVRVIDYKTGKVGDKDLDINDGNAESVVNALFGDKEKTRPGIALQLFLYDMFVSSDRAFKGKKIINSIYQPSKLFVDPPPQVPLSEEFCRLVTERLEDMLEDMMRPETPWRRTSETDTCKYCDFKKICGR